MTAGLPPRDTPASAARRGAPRTKPADQRRRELLDAGLTVFLDRGVAAATLEQVTRQAGIAKGTFYLHFDSKEHLLAALQVDFEATLVSRLDAAVAATHGEWVDRLNAWVNSALADYPAERALHDVLFHHPLIADDVPVPEDHRAMVDSLVDVLNGGVTAGEFHVDDIEVTAMLLCSALHRAFDRIWHRHTPIDITRLHTALRMLFHHAVGL